MELTYPIEQQVKTDNLNETVSYADVYETIESFVLNHNYNLIESLANNLLTTLLANYLSISDITIKVRKYSVPIAGIFDNIEIEVSGSQQHG